MLFFQDGRTPLHYAAALKDNHEMYNMLIAYSANPLVLDYVRSYFSYLNHVYLNY